jgi:type 1 fimbriae regulatory protein FimB
MTNDRKHITEREVEKLMVATKGSRFEARDRCLLLMMFRHGLRVPEACALQLDQVDTESRVIYVARLKKGLSITHPLRAEELRVIKAWLAERASMKATGRAFFVSQHRKPLNRRTARLTIRKYGDLAGLELPAHPHQLRHACGFALADQAGGAKANSGPLRSLRHQAYRHLHGDKCGEV